MPRVFIAIPVAPHVRAALASLPTADRRSWRRVREEQFHITVKFLGEISEQRVEDVSNAVSDAVAHAKADAVSDAVAHAKADAVSEAVSNEAAEAVSNGVRETVSGSNEGADAVQASSVESNGITLSAKGIGAFPNVRRARVLWAGVSGGVGRLRKVQAGIEAKLAKLGFPTENRRFTPHITLARSRGPGQPLPASWEPYAEHAFGRWQPSGIQVIESILEPSGPRYIVRQEIGIRRLSTGFDQATDG